MPTRRELTVLLLAFLVTLPAVTTRFYASDEVEYFAWLRSVVFDRDVDFENEYRYFYDAGVARSPAFYETFLERTNEIGRRINYAPVGTAILWAPFYGVGHLVARLSGAPTDGFSQPYISAAAYGSACYGFLAILLSAAIARRVVGRGVAASVATALGTPLLFYAYIAPGFSHAASAFSAALFVWIWLVVRTQWSVPGAIALGLCGGLMATVREQDLLLVIGPGLDFLRHWLRPAGPEGPAYVPTGPAYMPAESRPGDAPRPASAVGAAIAGAVAFAAAYAPQLVAYQALNGHPGPTETLARKMSWTAPHALSVLISSEHGLLAWTPLVLVALAGLVAMAIGLARPGVRGSCWPIHRDASWIAVLALLMIAGQVYISGSVESWTVAGSFGQRRFLALTPLLTLGLAAMFVVVPPVWPRRVLLVLVALCVWWNLGLMAQFGMKTMDRQKLTLAENARRTFLELPLQAPAIAWRYVTDRSSFYQPR